MTGASAGSSSTARCSSGHHAHRARPYRPSTSALRGSRRRRPTIPTPAPVMTANLLRPLLLELATRLETAPAHLIAGGLLVHECDEVVAAFAAAGLGERERRESGEWAALWLTG